jgi:hypothetical protein
LQLGTGLTNLGKSCYQNAIFQVFWNTPPALPLSLPLLTGSSPSPSLFLSLSLSLSQPPPGLSCNNRCDSDSATWPGLSLSLTPINNNTKDWLQHNWCSGIINLVDELATSEQRWESEGGSEPYGKWVSEWVSEWVREREREREERETES